MFILRYVCHSNLSDGVDLSYLLKQVREWYFLTSLILWDTRFINFLTGTQEPHHFAFDVQTAWLITRATKDTQSYSCKLGKLPRVSDKSVLHNNNDKYILFPYKFRWDFFSLFMVLHIIEHYLEHFIHIHINNIIVAFLSMNPIH